MRAFAPGRSAASLAPRSAAVFGLLCALWASHARAAEPHGIDGFDPTWKYRRFGWVDAAVTGAAGGFFLTSAFVWSRPDEPRWDSPVLFDKWFRDALRADSRAGRDRARFVGDALYFSVSLAPFLVDTALVALVVRGAPDVAAQMFLVNAQAYAISGALLSGSEHLFARARPSNEPCESDPEYEFFCGVSDRNMSFISGHPGIVATSAGLLCAHHQYLKLYGSEAADLAACLVGVSAALTTGTARIINDRHYATDVLAAFGVGALTGYALPVLSFYETGSVAESSVSWTIVPQANVRVPGLQLLGAF